MCALFLLGSQPFFDFNRSGGFAAERVLSRPSKDYLNPPSLSQTCRPFLPSTTTTSSNLNCNSIRLTHPVTQSPVDRQNPCLEAKKHLGKRQPSFLNLISVYFALSLPHSSSLYQRQPPLLRLPLAQSAPLPSTTEETSTSLTIPGSFPPAPKDLFYHCCLPTAPYTYLHTLLRTTPPTPAVTTPVSSLRLS